MRDASEPNQSTDNDVQFLGDSFDLDKNPDDSTPKKGRVWRRRSETVRKANGPVLRATVKPVKRFRPDSSPASQLHPTVVIENIAPLEKPKKTHHCLQSDQQNFKKKRVREQWTIEDKNHFFEAVAVHGKDFEAIQKAIAQKHRKKGDESAIKTKDQVRHLYYRTWTTVNKLLTEEAIDHRLSKASQELNAVINYGELWKRFGGYLLKKKEILKLTELINYGSTSVRIKGKTYRIKTPACKALKKIRDKEASKSSVSESRRARLPVRTVVDFFPLTMKAWNKVHLLGHNPRVRFNLPLSCRLSTVLAHLNKKWRTLSQKMFEVAEFGSSMPKPPDGVQLSNSVLQIHVPNDVLVKSKIEIHRIVNTKTNCVVSYAMQKLIKSKFTRQKKKSAKDSIEKIEPIDVDTCNSSDEEYVQLHHASDPELLETELPVQDWSILDDDEEEDIHEKAHQNFEAQCNGVDTNVNATTTDEALPDSDKLSGQLETAPLGESTDSQSSSDSVVGSSQVSECPSNVTEDNNSQAQAKEKGLSDETSLEMETVLATSQGEKTDQEDKETTLLAATEQGAMDSETALPEGQESPGVETVNHKVVMNEEVGVCKYWDEESAGDVSLAEIYLMLGKPNQFRLCYDWICTNTQDKCDTTTAAKTKFPMSTGLAALLQTATLLRAKAVQGAPDSKQTAKAPEKAPQSQKMVNAGVQCNIIEKELSVNSVLNSSPSSFRKASSKGANRANTAATGSEASSSFVMPSAPVRKRKVIQTEPGAKIFLADSSPNADEIRQMVQERVGDVKFRKQIEALNRRIDLFRPQSRNRTRPVRKPFVVQRTMMPNSGEVRKMMSLSIVSCGSNKVGFASQASVTTASFPTQPVTSNAAMEVSTTAKEVDRLLGDAIGLKLQTQRESEDLVEESSTGESLIESTARETVENEPQNGETTFSPIVTASGEATSSTFTFTSSFGFTASTSTFSDTDSITDSCVPSFPDIAIRPLTPSMDSLLAGISLDSAPACTPELVLPVLSSDSKNSRGNGSGPSSPSNPWMNGTYPPSPASFVSLNTPQRVLSDNEDSLDGLGFSPSKRLRMSYLGGPSHALHFLNEPEVDVHLQSLIGENSVDLVAKFQDLIQQTCGEEDDTSAKAGSDADRDS